MKKRHEIVAAYRRSGLTKAAFAKREGIPEGRLHYWIYGGRQRRQAAPAPVRLLPVRVTPQSVEPSSVEVVLARGVRLLVETGSSVEYVAALARALE